MAGRGIAEREDQQPAAEQLRCDPEIDLDKKEAGSTVQTGRSISEFVSGMLRGLVIYGLR